jgi:hypothetical protein
MLIIDFKAWNWSIPGVPANNLKIEKVPVTAHYFSIYRQLVADKPTLIEPPPHLPHSLPTVGFLTRVYNIPLHA